MTKKTLVKGKLLKNENIAPNIFKQTIFVGDVTNDILPMQFCSIYTGKGEMILPRPISIFNVDKDQKTIEIVFFTFGKGTTSLSHLLVNDEMDILLPLGNGIDVNSLKDCKKIALVGGGIGVPPLYYLATLCPNLQIDVYLGYRDEPFLNDYFSKLENVNVFIASDNSNDYFKGNVIELMKQNNTQYDKVVSCGPTVMLKALSTYCNDENMDCLISLEERMACSIGACVGCIVPIKVSDTEIKNKKVCVDGPVFNSKVVCFNE